MNNTIKIINKGIDNGFQYFYFKGFKLIASSQDKNMGSFDDLNVNDCIELYIRTYITEDNLIEQLKFYNNLR